MDQPNSVRLIACPHIFSHEKGRIDVMRPPGGTVSDIMRSISWTHDVSARVFLNGVFVEESEWHVTRPCAGQSLTVRAIPTGGSNGKDVGRMVAMISIMVLAVATQQYWAVPLLGMEAATVAGIGIAGSSLIATLAVSACIPPALPRLYA